MTTTKNKTRIKVETNNAAIYTHTKFAKHPATTAILVFLDFDGVLHGFKGGALFSCLERFEAFLRDHPNALVVFSTSWRFNQSFEMMVGYFSKDLHDRFVGATPTVQEKWPPYTKYERLKECHRFMDENNYYGKWIAIDDAKDLFMHSEGEHAHVFITDGQLGYDEDADAKFRAKIKLI